MQAKGYTWRKPADHFIMVWLSSKSVFIFFFLPHSFFTGTNELTQSSADNSLCNLTCRTLLLYSESYTFVTLKNVFVILPYFSFVSVIRRRGDCLRRICIVTSEVCLVLLSSAYILIEIAMIFFLVYLQWATNIYRYFKLYGQFVAN